MKEDLKITFGSSYTLHRIGAFICFLLALISFFTMPYIGAAMFLILGIKLSFQAKNGEESYLLLFPQGIVYYNDKEQHGDTFDTHYFFTVEKSNVVEHKDLFILKVYDTTTHEFITRHLTFPNLYSKDQKRIIDYFKEHELLYIEPKNTKESVSEIN